MALLQAVKDVPIKNFMFSDVVSLNVDEHFSAVYNKMNLHRIRHLPVLDNQKRVIGIITERDLFRIHSPRKIEDEWVYDQAELDRLVLKFCMTKDPLTLTPDDTLFDAITFFTREKFGCIPIVDKDKKLEGIITPFDVLKYFLSLMSQK